MCTFSQKIARSGAVHRRGNRWTDGPMLEGCPLCVARKWVPRRARGEGRARPPPLQHPTPPRRRRRPRPHSRYQRHPRSMTMAACARCPSPSSRPTRDHEGSWIASVASSRRKTTGRRWQTTVVTCWLRGGGRWGLIVRWCVAPRDVARDETLDKSRVSASCWFDRGVEGEKFRHPSARKVGSI